MASKTRSALGALALLALLTLVLAGCGGGSTAGPIAQSQAATTIATATTAPPQTEAGASPATAAATTPTAPTPTAPAQTPRPARRRAAPPAAASGGAAPSGSGDDGALADAPDAGEASLPAPAAEPVTAPLDERAQLVLTRRVSPSHYFQQGTVTGTYDGTMAVEARITSKGVIVRFTATLPGGTISGRGVAVAILDSATWPGLRGRAVVTGGTGRFAHIRGRGLQVTGRAKPDASRAHVRLAGTVSGI